MINISKILCPVDFFSASDAAVSYAARLAANYDAVVRLLHVVTPVIVTTPYDYAVDTVAIMKSMEEASAEEMRRLALRVKEAGAVCEIEIRIGDVYDEIKGAIEA